MQRFVVRDLGGVGGYGPQGLGRRLWLAGQESLGCPAGGEEAEQKVDGQSGTTHDGLANEHIRVGDETI